MADAAAMSGSEKTPEQPPRVENSSGLSGEENRAAAAVEASESPQNGARSERSRSDEESLLESRGSPRSGHRKTSVSEQLCEGLGGSLPKASEDLPLKKNFQIPRKNREKKALFQPITKESREFEDVVNILHSSYLEIHSKDNFIYKKASLIHSELLEKEFIEKRRELKRDGRSEKELAESYAFLKIDRSLVQNICENGLQVGNSKITVLGNPSLGVYLSRYADLLQANPLEANATGDIIIFKVIKGRMKTIYENLGTNQMDSTIKTALDPTPKFECHVSKSANRIASLFSYRAYERAQYYFYEYGFDEIRQRPRHICPYAVVSFSFKEEKGQKYSSQARSKNSNMDKNADKTSYTLWNGQLLNRGTLVCHAALKSETCPLLPCKLPEKLDVEMVMSIDRLTQAVPPRILSKEAYSGEKEEFKNGLYCSLYEVVEKTRSGSNLEGLLQKLETDKLVIVKPLIDRGYLLLLSSYQTASPYENRMGRPHTLQALFLLRNPRAQKREHKNENTSVLQESHVIMPELTRFIQSLHYAYVHSRKDPKSDLNILVEKYINDYLKRYSKNKEFFLYKYKETLDEKRHLFAGPKNKSHLENSLRSYVFGPEAYQVSVSKAKKLMAGYRKPQQFSPVSDYEAQDEEFDYTKRKPNKRNGSECETVAAKRKSGESTEYDRGSIEQLISLIYDKKNADKESDTEESRNENRLKRKLESKRDILQKHLKTNSSPENTYQYEGNRAPETVPSVIDYLGGHDTDLRQNVSEPSVADCTVLKLLSEILSNMDTPLGRFVKQSSAENYSRQNVEYSPNPLQVKQEPEIPGRAHVENIPFRDSHSPVKLETSAPCLPYSLDISTTEADTTFHMTHLKDASTGSVSSFDGCNSPCSSTPVEQNYHRQHSTSSNIHTSGIHWKLIPITGGAGRVPEAQLREHGDNQTDLHKGGTEDREFAGQELKYNDQCELEINQCVTSEPTINRVIETAILEEYTHFTNKIQEILLQKNIMYARKISRPVISARERVMRLSEYLCLQASGIAVQEYVERLSEKLHSVVLSSTHAVHKVPFTCTSEQAADSVTDTELNPYSEELVPLASDIDVESFQEPPPCNNVKGDSNNEKNGLTDTGKQQSSVRGSTETKLIAESNISTVDPPLQQDKAPKPVDDANATTQTAVVDLINQLKPEMFDSFIKIIEDVRKNTVKFYIHEEQESALCKEIKEYLIQLGNSECHPEQFLRGRANRDKLLIIIQNEDIASLIHKIPCLVTLKRLSCVSFAGVDSLDDVKTRTYNELFVSGGFIVSDESVLNPESVTVDKLSTFLKFLEELSTPDGKWQWKVHCKIQKKLKELGRTNVNAVNLLTLLSAYQKKHVVEILSYHSCDSQTRNPPELDCLIKLQAQNIQQRHIVFLTEKNVSAFAAYASNGIVVTTMDFFMHSFKSLVGYHYSITGENYSPSPIDHERQSVLVENEKDEEDMSLDSGDEASQIEVCNDASKYDSHLEAFETKTKGSHGTDTEQNSHTDALLSTEGGSCLLTGRTAKTDMQDIQPVTPVSVTCSVEGEITNSVEQIPLSNFQIYNRQLSVPHQFSHFNVLTHQTFLGTTYPMSTSQIQEGGNYFLSAYSQNMDMDQSSTPSSWDVSCNSSRPFSKQN
uniref:Protein TASOR isoform X3 n=1 Tax=Pogona vitticeps TaxID=103695 RepID=A0ABM5FJY2_9SAUR